VNELVYSPATGRLEALPLAKVGQEVDGPDRIFPTVLADVYVGAKNVRRGRSLIAEVLHDPPVVAPIVITTRR
jgi:hypothetical protein